MVPARCQAVVQTITIFETITNTMETQFHGYLWQVPSKSRAAAAVGDSWLTLICYCT